jgi:signal transduction histidine kinase/CheY-like chemotaxis protein
VRAPQDEASVPGIGAPGSLGRWVLWALCAYTSAYCTYVLAHLGQDTRRFEDVGFLPLYLMPALGSWFAAQHTARARDRWGWRCVASAWLVSFAGACLWLLPSEARLLDAGAGALYNAYYPFLVAGLALFVVVPAGATERLRLALETAMVFVAVQVLSWYASHGAKSLTGLPNVLLGGRNGTSVGELAVLLTASIALHRPAVLTGRLPLQLLALGAFCASLGDLLMDRSLTGTVTQRQVGNILVACGAALFTGAAVLWIRRGPKPSGRWTGLLPYFALAATAAPLLFGLATEERGVGPMPGVLLATLLVFALVLTELSLFQRQLDSEELARAQDMEERRALETKLVRTQKLDALGLLAGGVAHDFNNLLTAIQGNALMLAERVAETPEIEEIRRAVERGAALCRQLLTFSRSEPGRTEAIDVGAVLVGIEPMLRRLIPSSIELVIRPPLVGTHVRADRVHLEIALLNLVINARDAMPAGGTLTLEAGHATRARGSEPTAACPTRTAWIAVKDTGVGMDAATQARIFEPFFSTKPVGKGAGLGLATVHGFVSRSGGDMQVDSAPGCGSTFVLYLPACEGPAEESAHKFSRPRSVAARGRVLLVDDDPAVLSVTSALLGSAGFEVHVARDGLEAVELLTQHAWRFDLVLTDATMPRMDGHELSRRVAQARPDLPVLLMSGNPQGSGDQEGPEAPPVIPKPFRSEELFLQLDARIRARSGRPVSLES